MIEPPVDLHIHTTCSDGELSVDEVLLEAEKKGLKFVGIVDHDTVEQFEKVNKSKVCARLRKGGVRVWVGTEFSTSVLDKKMHIIGYNFDYKAGVIKDLIRHLVEMRHAKLDFKLARIESYGLGLKEEQVKRLRAMDNAGMPHIAKCMQENGVEGSVDSIIKKYLKDNNVFRVEAKEIIDAVHAAGGIIVIAHPYQIASENHISFEDAKQVISQLIDLGADGMECFYSLYNEEQISTLLALAKERGLLITCGSDFHGEGVKPGIPISRVSGVKKAL